MSVQATGGGDYALLVGSNSDDTFSAEGEQADFTGAGFAHHVAGFPLTETAAKGGTNDQALYTGTAYNESFNGTYVYGRWAVMPGDGREYLSRAVRFDHVTATTTPESGDTARFEDSIYGDVFEAEAFKARMHNLRCDNRAEGFSWVNAYALNGGGNTAHLTYSSTTDTLATGLTNARIFSSRPPSYFVRAWYFDEVLAHDLAVSGSQALLAPSDSAWADLAAALAAWDTSVTHPKTATPTWDQIARDRLFELILAEN